MVGQNSTKPMEWSPEQLQQLREMFGSGFQGGSPDAPTQEIQRINSQLPQGQNLKNQQKDRALTQAGISIGGQVIGDQLDIKGVPGYGLGAYNVYQAATGKGSTKDRILQGGTGASQIAGAAGVPGMGYVAPVLGGIGIASSDASPEQKAQATRRLAEDTGLNIATGGVSGLVQLADKQFLGGKINNLRNKYDKIMDSPIGMAINPIGFATNKITGKAMEKAFSLGGSGKGEDQQQRDVVRKMLKESGFLGDPKAEDWNLENPDGTSFDIGKDGGARLEDGRRYSDVDTTKQGAAIGAVNPLAYIITGGDEKLATNFAGYFTNTITQGEGATNPETARLNALDKYKKAGIDTPDKAIAKIDELLKSGKIDEEKAAAFKGGIASVFSPSAPTTPSGSATRPATTSAPSRKPARRMTRYARNVYTPNTYEIPQVAPPAVDYGGNFAEALANVYADNQRL